MPEMTPIPPALRTEATCDYCYRPFVRAAGAAATCPNCGLDNVRRDVAALESNMLPGGPEKAVLPDPQPKPRRRRK